MKVLILYATVEGQTHKIANFAKDLVLQAGHDAWMVDAGKKTVTVSFADVDKVILAASVHERRHPKAFEVLVGANRAELNARDTLMISVSLKAAFPKCLDEAQEYLTEMEMRTGITFDSKTLAAGAVRSGSYDYFETQVLQHVVLEGQEYHPSDGDREFTDWDALKDNVSKFLST